MKTKILLVAILVLTYISISPALLPAVYAKQQDKVTKAEATKAVKVKLPGAKILSSELEKEAGKQIWSFDVRDKGVLKEVWVDASTGEVIHVSTESNADQAKEARMDKAEALVKRSTHGEVVGSTDVGKGKNEIYDFEVKMKDATTKHVRVNAMSLKIVGP